MFSSVLSWFYIYGKINKVLYTKLYFSIALLEISFLVKILNSVIISISACKFLYLAFWKTFKFCVKFVIRYLAVLSDGTWTMWFTEFDQRDFILSQLYSDCKKSMQWPYRCELRVFPDTPPTGLSWEHFYSVLIIFIELYLY